MTETTAALSAAPETFDAFAARTLDSSYRIASLITRDARDAEEATHAAYLAAAKRWRRGRRGDAAARDAWFGRLLIHACRDQIRGRRRMAVTDISDQLLIDRSHPSDSIWLTADTRPADREALAHAFGRLGLDHRVCLVLHYGAEFELPRVAEWTRMSERTVAARLREALGALGVAYEPAGSALAA